MIDTAKLYLRIKEQKKLKIKLHQSKNYINNKLKVIEANKLISFFKRQNINFTLEYLTVC